MLHLIKRGSHNFACKAELEDACFQHFAFPCVFSLILVHKQKPLSGLPPQDYCLDMTF